MHNYQQYMTHHITIPVTPPKNVLVIRAVSPNVVSPRKRAIVNWPMKLEYST